MLGVKKRVMSNAAYHDQVDLGALVRPACPALRNLNAARRERLTLWPRRPTLRWRQTFFRQWPPLVAPERAGRSDADSVGALEATVALLKANALAGGSQPLLRGRNIGILCEEPQRPEVFLLQRAAADLGARVSLVRSELNEEDAPLEVEKTGRVLGQLYDALICIDVSAQLVEGLRRSAGIPAIADLAGEWIALRAMHPDVEDNGRYLLQALLIGICR